MDKSLSNSLRITLVIPTLECGGAEKVMVNLAGQLEKVGHRITLLTLESESHDFFLPPPSVDRRFLTNGTQTSCRWFDLASQSRRTAAYRDAVLDSQPDVVISFLDTTNIAILLALRGTGIPVIVSEHIDPRYHSIGWRWALLRRLIYPQAAAITVLTESVRSWAEGLRPRWRVCTITNALEPVDHHEEPIRPHYFGRRNIAAMGRLVPQKGFDLLIKAFASQAERFPEWHLSILGEGSERAELEKAVAVYGLEGRIHLPGIERTPEKILPTADFFVASSRYEGFSLVIAEAMAAGLPVVSFDCPTGPGDIIRNGIDGLLVPQMDIPALADAMARLMGDEGERRRLASRAIEVTERFSSKRILGQWLELIESVLANRQSQLGSRATP